MCCNCGITLFYLTLTLIFRSQVLLVKLEIRVWRVLRALVAHLAGRETTDLLVNLVSDTGIYEKEPSQNTWQNLGKKIRRSILHHF